MRDYSKFAGPLEKLTHGYNKRKRIKWTVDLDESFVNLQVAVAACAKLYLVQDNSKDEILLETNASDYGIGAYLFQVRWKKGVRHEYPIAFISNSLNETERK